ncbi:MAG TPA: VWA domain-containing protein [Pyrinomonadaceae bacterium]|nr:VWA domain-containing protein [Pyrinomonadaceae bacterium]
MKTRNIRRVVLWQAMLAIALTIGFSRASFVRNDVSHAQTPNGLPQASPTPPKKEDEITLNSDDVVRVETNLTNVFFTAADKQKRFVSTLKKEDVRIFEDGVPQEVFTFQPNSDLPLSLAILIDCSGSEERTLPEEKNAARAFLESVLRPERDEAAIVSFTGEVTLEQGLTGNIARLRRAIDEVRFVPPSGYIGGGVVVGGTPPISGTRQILAGSTAIWDAIWATSNELLSASAEHTRRAMILLTDGEDTISQVKMQEAINRALKADSLIYAIGIGDRYEFGINEGALKKLTEQTGGRAFFPSNERDLATAFAQIERDLRERYLIAYSSSNKLRDGSYRKVTIEIVNPTVRRENLKLNYRPGYFAKTAVPEGSQTTKKP